VQAGRFRILPVEGSGGQGRKLSALRVRWWALRQEGMAPACVAAAAGWRCVALTHCGAAGFAAVGGGDW
jgi:hypothetical protein